MSRLAMWMLMAAAVTSAQTPSETAARLCSDPLTAQLPQCAGTVSGAGTAKLPAQARPVAPQVNAADGAQKSDASPPPAPPEPLPPEPPGEFQQFVAAATGQRLAVFGASLFERAPSTFAPLERVPVTAGYVLGPGDEVLIRAWGQVQLNLDLTVDRNGAIFLPQVGAVTVAGVGFEQLQALLRGQLDRVYRNFELNVSLGRLRSIEILMVGEARRPGVCTVSAMASLLNALFACGGPSAQGSMRRAELLRAGRTVASFDLYELLLGGERSRDARLEAGDLLRIAGAGAQVALTGSVRRPAIYELSGSETLARLIEIAGGLTPVADGHRVQIERLSGGRRRLVEVDLAQAPETALANGDLVTVATLAQALDNVVTLRGNVANPGRFAWRPGLRLADIIPNKESLITRAYWEKHHQLGHAPVQFTPLRLDEDGTPEARTTRVGPLAPEVNWSYAVIERRRDSDLGRQLLPFHPGRLVLEHDAHENHELRPGDVVTLFSQRDLRVPVAQQNLQVRLEGEFASPGIYQIQRGETLGQLIARVGGLTSNAYLYGAEFTRESARRDQQERLDQYIRDLERDSQGMANRLQSQAGSDDPAVVREGQEALRRTIAQLRTVKARGRVALGFSDEDTKLDALAQIELEDGDQLYVPMRPATVHVLGAVYNAGSLLHKREWRVKDYLGRSGGCTRAADRGRVFLVRADGTVVSRQSYGRFGASFEMARVRPGDSIVVPEALPRGSWMRSIRDWTQISSQLALSAAAVSILR